MIHNYLLTMPSSISVYVFNTVHNLKHDALCLKILLMYHIKAVRQIKKNSTFKY